MRCADFSGRGYSPIFSVDPAYEPTYPAIVRAGVRSDTRMLAVTRRETI
jgi:hypothetical protein